jgi:zinc protease
MEVVAGADRALLKGYYDKWYTAANSAIIIVGNIDAAEVEEKVKRYFSTLAKKDTPEKADSSIPLQNGVRFGIVTDPELNDTFFSINFFVEEGEITTYRELKRYILEAGALSMLNRRVGGAILEKEIDLLSFRGAKTSLDDNNLSVLRFIVNSKPESIEEDFKTALIEIERAKRFGFTAEELKEYTATQKTFIDRAASPDYKYPSERFAEAIADYDTNGGHFTEFSQDKVLLDKIFSETEIDDYNRAFNSLIESKSELVLITAPEMEKGKIAFTEEIFSRIKNETAAMQLEPRKAEAVVDSLIDALPKGGEVQSRTKYESLNGELITYTNGVRLFIKKNPIDRGHFAFSARKPGGHSSLNNSDALYIDLLPQIISASGFENITRRQLQILTAGRQARVQFRVVEYMFELMGGGDSEDLEIFFQLLYKYFTSANVDENAFSAIIKASETNLANTEKDRMTAFFRDAAREMNNGKYRRNYLLSSDLASVAPDALLKLYKDNFEDAGNFIFVLSGDLDIDLTVELGRIYLGGLAEPEKKSAALSRGVKLNKPFGIKEGNGDVEKKSTVQIRFDNDIKPFENGEYVIALARRILYQRIRENIREDKGGAYSVNVAVGYSKYPDASFFGRIFFTCDPERKDELIKEIRAILDKFAKDGVNEDELAVAKAQQTALYESVKDDNSFWANDISYCITAGDKLLSADEYKDLINSITLASVNRAVSTFMEGMRTFIAVYNPEDKR